MESMFLVKDSSIVEERTFSKEESLQSLPLPQLYETLNRYLDSCKAVLTEEEFDRTKQIVEKFQQNEGPKLQEILSQKASVEKNWLEDWWLNGYLDYRGPLGVLNFGASATLDFLPSVEDSQLHRGAMMLHSIMNFWKHLRNETVRQLKDRKGNTLSMNQFRYIFNTSRIALKGRDKLANYFKTKSEGDCPSHMIIFHHQHAYKLKIISENGEIYTPGQIYKLFLAIKEQSGAKEGDGVSAMSELDRDSWAEAREYLSQLSPRNAKTLEDIESAIMTIALVDDKVKDDSALMTLGTTKVAGNRWADKYFMAISSDGRFTCSTDHTPSEGMTFVTLMMYNEVLLRERWNNGQWEESWNNESLPSNSITKLEFDLDEKLHNWIEKGRKTLENFGKESTFHIFDFNDFGKDELKQLRIHPCAFNQMCFQLAYMRKHRKPGPTYETASTRSFYHGRTETLRSCTPEIVEFCNAVINDLPNKQKLLMKACEKYMKLMSECSAGRGVDRHMLGLAAIAMEKGTQLPEIFTDSAFKKSGGNNNFVLSTSLAGYSGNMGATVPMVSHGYGIFFRVLDHSMHYAVTTYNPTPDVCASDMETYLRKAFQDVCNIAKGLS
ncbi:peroxisomal carnitine O-octanoyltransferase-like isoform X2 [Styela clava]